MASDEGIEAVLDHVRTLPGCAEIEVKESRAAAMPFHRTKVRLKKEIVTMGQPDLDPLAGVGTYVAPDDWNTLISNPETILIDTRNDYEVQIGTFKGAIDPETKSFREFPSGSVPSAPRSRRKVARPRSPCSAPAASTARSRPLSPAPRV